MFGKLVAFLVITVASARDLYLFNKLDRDIIVSITGKSDVSLGVGTKEIVSVSEEFQGRIVAKNADCKSEICDSVVTLVELTLNENVDFYDVSLISGFNLPVRVVARSSGFCREASCFNENLLKSCPNENKVEVDGALVACKYTSKLFAECYEAISSDDESAIFNCRGQPKYNIIYEFV